MGDGEAFFPASGEAVAFLVGVGKAGEAEPGVVGGDVIFDDAAFGEDGVLGDARDLEAFFGGDDAGIGIVETGEDLEQCRFTCAIGADEAEALVVFYCEGDVLEKDCGTKLLGQRLDREEKTHCI